MAVPAIPEAGKPWLTWAQGVDAEARKVADKADATDPRLTDARTPADSSVTNAKVAANAAISADKLADGTTGKVLTAAERTKLAGIATGATANSTDATLLARANHTGTQAATTITGLATVATSGSYADLSGKPTTPTVTAGTTAGQIPVWDGDSYEPQTPAAVTKADVGLGNVDNTADTAKPVSTAQQTAIDAAKARANHTGTQSADTIVDGTTNHTFTAADDTKLAGIATNATANATDAQLRDRSTHTGTQPIDTIKARVAKKNKTDNQDVTLNNTSTTITLQNTTFNRGSMDVATANVIKPGVTGPVLVTIAAYLVGGAVGDRSLLIMVNGAVAAEIPAAFVSGSIRVAGAVILDLAATDSVGLSLYLGGGVGTVTVSGAGGVKDVNLAVASLGID